MGLGTHEDLGKFNRQIKGVRMATCPGRLIEALLSKGKSFKEKDKSFGEEDLVLRIGIFLCSSPR